MQTTVQSARAIRLGSATLTVNGINVGALQNAKLKIEESILQLVADNARLAPRKRITKATISADLWEIGFDALALLDGVGTLTSTPGTSTNVTSEVLKVAGATWNTNEVLFFANAQGAGTVATAIVIKNNSTTLVLGTDYSIVVVNGKTGVVRIGTGLVALTTGIKADYTYTPNVKKTYTGLDVTKLIGMYPVEISNIDENGKKFGIKFPQAYNASGIEWSFSSDEKLDEVMKYPIELTALPDATNTWFIMDDEQTS